MLIAALIAVGLVAAFGLWLYLTGARRDGAPPTSPSRDSDLDAPEDVADATAIVLLPGNVWDACAFDGHQEEWARFTSRPVRGFGGVPSGRHRVITTCASGVATLDFVLYPGDVFARRLDPAAARWGPCADDADAAPGPAESLVAHRTVLGIARAMRGDAVVDPDAAVRRTCAALEELFARVGAAEREGQEEKAEEAGEREGTEDALLREATALGETLVGVPLTRRQLGVLTGTVVHAADHHEAASSSDRARTVARLGLAMLPGDRALLALFARSSNRL